MANNLMGNDLFRMGMGILEGATPQATPPNAIANMMRGLGGARDARYQDQQRMLQKQQAIMQLQQLRRAQEEHAYKLKIRKREEDQLVALTDVTIPDLFADTADQSQNVVPSGFASSGFGDAGVDGSLPQVGGEIQPAGGLATQPQTYQSELSPYAKSMMAPLIRKAKQLQIKLQNPTTIKDHIANQNALVKLNQDKAKLDNLFKIGEQLPPGEIEMFYQDPKGYMATRQAPSQARRQADLAAKNSGPFKRTENIGGMDYEVTGTRDLYGNEVEYSRVAKPDSPEKVAKLQMLKTAQAAYNGQMNPETGQYEGGAKSFIYNEDGTPNKTALLLAALPVPLGAGRPIATRMEFGIQAITRGETGAAMPPSEVVNTRIRFMPSLLDSDEDIALKLQMFEMFINNSIDLLDKTTVGKPKLDGAKFEREMSKLKAKQGDLTDPFGIIK